MALERNGQHDYVSGGGCGGIVGSGNVCARRALVLILSAACWARAASREPMMMVSPARAQRRASPKPSLPVPPRIAMFMGILSHEPRCRLPAGAPRYERLGEFVFERLFSCEFCYWSFDLDARVGGVALGGNASRFQNQ